MLRDGRLSPSSVCHGSNKGKRAARSRGCPGLPGLLCFCSTDDGSQGVVNVPFLLLTAQPSLTLLGLLIFKNYVFTLHAALGLTLAHAGSALTIFLTVSQIPKYQVCATKLAKPSVSCKYEGDLLSVREVLHT